jgi:hypothetical protein
MMITTEKIKEIFLLFVGTDEIRPKFNQPFKQDGKYIATDCNSLILLSENTGQDSGWSGDLLGFGAQTDPNCSGVIQQVQQVQPEQIEINLADLEAQLIPDYEDEKRDEETKCDDCEGSGSVDFVYNSRGISGKTYKNKEDCPVCGGGGKTSKEVLTGNKVPIMTTQFKMLGVGFMYRQLKRLLDASKLAGVTSITWLASNKKGPNLFQVGIFSIIVMPCLLEEPGYMEEPTYKQIKGSV